MTNTVLRAAAVSSVLPPSVVVDRTTLVTVEGALLVMVAIVGAVVAVVEAAVGVLVTDAGTVVDVVRNIGVLEGDEDWLDITVLDVVSIIIILLASLDTPMFGTKMRGGDGGTNAIMLDAGTL